MKERADIIMEEDFILEMTLIECDYNFRSKFESYPYHT